MAIPTRDKGAVKSLHTLEFDHDVLEDFVESRADMDIAVGIRRPVMQDILGLAVVLLENGLVEIEFGPLAADNRLFLGQVCLHREIGLGQIQGLLVIGLFGLGRFIHKIRSL